MNHQNNISDELKDLNSDLPVSKNNPNSVPDGYFDGLASSILSKIGSQNSSDELKTLSPFLASISKQMPYTVPLNYFENTNDALAIIMEDEKSPLLSSIGKETPYQVPFNYFQDFSSQLTSKLFKPEAKVIPMFNRSWVRVAAAAVIGGLLFLTGYNFFAPTPSNEIATTNDTTKKESVIAQKNVQPTTIIKEIKSISTKDLETFIKNVDVDDKKHIAKSPSAIKELKEELKDVSDTELDSFLDQIPTSEDDLTQID